MAIAKRLKRAAVAVLTVLGLVLWFVALLLITSVGIAVLLALIVSNLWQLVRDYRRHVPGSRLRARMVTLLVMVAVTPLVGVYIFSVEFINRGIDNWFSPDIERGLNEAFERGQTALEAEKLERLSELERIAVGINTAPRNSLARVLSGFRAESGALQI